MIWEFYKTEKYHGKSAKAYDPVLHGQSRKYIFSNYPPRQRICHCQRCRVKIPREVPRIFLSGSFYYGAGYYCMSCGLIVLEEKRKEMEEVTKKLTTSIENIEELKKLALEVMENEFYEKKMALGRMVQVMSEKGDSS